jgi:putative signal transducing protein
MMICPQCGGEYRDGFTQCVDCEGPLVAAPPEPVDGSEPEPEPDTALVSVLETGDPAEMAFVESLLLEGNIPYVKQGDRVQDLFGIGRVGGFNVLTGPAKLLVGEEHVEAAREILRDLAAAEPVVGEESAELGSDAEAE